MGLCGAHGIWGCRQGAARHGAVWGPRHMGLCVTGRELGEKECLGVTWCDLVTQCVARCDNMCDLVWPGVTTCVTWCD